jgi:hypothetical protein
VIGLLSLGANLFALVKFQNGGANLFARVVMNVLGTSAIKIAAPGLVNWLIEVFFGGANLFAPVMKYGVLRRKSPLQGLVCWRLKFSLGANLFAHVIKY